MSYRVCFRAYGAVCALTTYSTFHGTLLIEQITAKIGCDDFMVELFQIVSTAIHSGQLKVFCKFSGQPLQVSIPNCIIKAKVAARAKADSANPTHIAAPIPELIIGIITKIGQTLTIGDIILRLEAMKMQTALTAERSGVVKAVDVKPGDQAEAKVLVAELGMIT